MCRLFFAALLLALCLSASSQVYRIGVMGSSTASGIGATPLDSAWIYRMKKFYMGTGIVDTVHNLCAGGRNCYEAMPTEFVPPPGRPLPNIHYNITRMLMQVPLPTHLILSYPSNGYDSLPPAEVIFCLQTLKNIANANGIICYVTTTQPREDAPGFDTFDKRVRLKLLRDLIMQTFGEFAIDLWTDMVDPLTLSRKTEYAYNDMIHLNNNGHDYIFNRLINRDFMNVTNKWTGSINQYWEYPGNWSRGTIPGQNELVLIPALPYQVIINSNLVLRGLALQNGASVKVNPGFKVQLKKP